MKISVSRDALTEAMKSLSAIHKPSELPIYGGVLIDNDGGVLTMTASNFETELSVGIKAVVENGGKTVIPRRALQQFVQVSRSETIEMSVGGNGMVVTDGQMKVVLPIMKHQDFVRLEGPDMEVVFDGDHDQIERNLEWVASATNPTMNDLSKTLCFDGNRILASDRHSFHVANVICGFKGVVMAENVRTIKAALSEGSNSRWQANGAMLVIESAHIRTVLRLVDQPWPVHSVGQVLDINDNMVKWDVKAQDVVEAVKRVAAVAPRPSSRVYLEGHKARSIGSHSVVAESELGGKFPNCSFVWSRLANLLDGQADVAIWSDDKRVRAEYGERLGAIVTLHGPDIS